MAEHASISDCYILPIPQPLQDAVDEIASNSPLVTGMWSSFNKAYCNSTYTCYVYYFRIQTFVIRTHPMSGEVGRNFCIHPHFIGARPY